ncbi:hypothetical protein TRAPUB_467 [Trametes pubescens]|uniref:Uncharacterized protein n=1 Tax=Trametes pubescens TaxID=154538 RepID=A0A1M2VM23_TRAPU|nr:hypothetical protein TRAPUB_467 [Trametes pubescens]
MIDVATSCKTCVSTIHTWVASFSEALYAAIEDVISKVRRLLLSVSKLIASVDSESVDAHSPYSPWQVEMVVDE